MYGWGGSLLSWLGNCSVGLYQPEEDTVQGIAFFQEPKFAHHLEDQLCRDAANPSDRIRNIANRVLKAASSELSEDSRKALAILYGRSAGAGATGFLDWSFKGHIVNLG